MGVDFGTSGCRAVLIDTAGEVVARAHAEIAAPLRDPDGRSEQDPELWWQAFTQLTHRLIEQADPRRIRSLAVDGTSATLVLTDHQGSPLAPAMMYDDTRSRDQLPRIRAVAPVAAPVHSAASSLAKLLYLLERHPGEPGRRALHQADWILGRLSASYGISDENNCLKLGYDAVHRRWPVWMHRLRLPEACLPRVLPPATPVARLSREAAAATGLQPGTLLVTGTTDSTAAVLATGISEPGEAVTSLGSTLVLKVLSPRPLFAAEYGIYSHRIGGHWLAGGASNSGGAVLAHFFSATQLRRLSDQIDPEVPSRLDYYPLLRPGERFPVNHPDLPPRLTPRPSQDHRFLQGMLEGIAAIEQRGYALLRQLGAPPVCRVWSIGGGASNPTWRRIRALGLGVPVLLAQQQDAAYGAALLARTHPGSSPP